MKEFIKKGFINCSEQKWSAFANIILVNFKEVTKLGKDSDPMKDDQSLMNGIVALTDLTSRFGNSSGLNLDKGILFIGNPGTGKTSLMEAYIRAYNDILGILSVNGHKRYVDGVEVIDGGQYVYSDQAEEILYSGKYKVSDAAGKALEKYLNCPERKIVGGIFRYEDGWVDVPRGVSSTKMFNAPFLYGSHQDARPVMVKASKIRELYAEGGYKSIRRYYDDEADGFIPFLIIDDLAYELSDAKSYNYGQQENPLNYVMTQRANSGLLTFGTANTINADPNNPFFSRIAGMFNIVSFNGKDHRI